MGSVKGGKGCCRYGSAYVVLYSKTILEVEVKRRKGLVFVAFVVGFKYFVLIVFVVVV